MIKKIISILISASLVFGLASCVKEKEDEGDSPSVQNSDVNMQEDFTNSDKDYTSPSETVTQIPTVKVTIPEGYTLVRISWLLEEKGLCKSEDFIDACQNYKNWLDLTQYPFLNDLQNAQNVCFALEGYFLPLTYDIPENATVEDIVKMLLNGSKQFFNETFIANVHNSGFTVHEILTLASLIEKEAKLPEQREMISSVLHNRLDAGMQFQCDPTVKYCTGVIQLIYPEKIDHYKYYYNTYRCKGLMAGPICNPGVKSIEAALYPATTDYLYFIIGMVEPYESKYSETFEEHNAYWQANKDRLTGQ